MIWTSVLLENYGMGPMIFAAYGYTLVLVRCSMPPPPNGARRSAGSSTEVGIGQISAYGE